MFSERVKEPSRQNNYSIRDGMPSQVLPGPLAGWEELLLKLGLLLLLLQLDTQQWVQCY
jgi:hypothetical protein